MKSWLKTSSDLFDLIWFYCIAANYWYITLTIKKYHITIAYNDVINKLAGSRSLCSLDDFNEYSSYCKENNWHAKFVYTTHLSALTWLKWFKMCRNFFFPRVLKKKTGFWGLLSTWRPLFHFSWKKGFCALLHPLFKSSKWLVPVKISSMQCKLCINY